MQQVLENTFSGPRPQNSLESFYFNDVLDHLLVERPFILDLGCGSHSIFSAPTFYKHKVIAIDNNPALIQEAPRDHVSYYCLDINEVNWVDRFDLVLDSYLFGCLISDQDREDYLKKIHQSLADNGVFALETLTYHKNLDFQGEYHLSQEHVLYKVPEMKPVRRVLPAFDIEQSLLKYFDIKVFKIHTGHKFIIHQDRELPLPTDPDVLRIVCQKK